MFKGASKNVVFAEKIKAEMTKMLTASAAGATARLAEIAAEIEELDAAIETAEESQRQAEGRLQEFERGALPGKQISDNISAVVLEVQTLERTLKGWYQKLDGLKAERQRRISQVSNETQAAFKVVKEEAQRMVDDEAAYLIEFLTATEQALSECGRVDRYIPTLKPFGEVNIGAPYTMHCPPKELSDFLRAKRL